MLKLWCLAATLFLIGCGYTQPNINEPYGIIQPTGGIRILKIDGERVIDLSGDYILRASPGNHILILAYGHNKKTPVEGSKSPYGKLSVGVEEGICYYIAPKLKYGLNDLFFGAGFKEVKAWKPFLKEKKEIKGYKKK